MDQATLGGIKWRFSYGMPETACGFGSKVASTESIRKWLPGMFRKYLVETFVDAPCGDFNWMSHTDLSGIHYIGIDYDRDNLAQAVNRLCLSSRPKSRTFKFLNILEEKLPECDMILCRDFLQHLPTKEAVEVIKKMMTSGAKQVLFTSHFTAENQDLEERGWYRPFNLMAPPVNMPDPVDWVPDGAGRILGLWRP